MSDLDGSRRNDRKIARECKKKRESKNHRERN